MARLRGFGLALRGTEWSSGSDRWRCDMSMREREEPYPRLPEDPGAEDDLRPRPPEVEDGQIGADEADISGPVPGDD
jgi:hypothetical protein